MSLSVETFQTLDQVAGAMGSDARFLAGGTLVMRDVNEGDQSFSRILRLPQMPSEIRAEDQRIIIDAGVTMHQVVASRDLDFLASVARSVGGPAVRAMGTVGGNLFAPHPYGDLAAALLALDGEVRFADGRTQPLENFFAERASAGLVAAVSINRPRSGEFRFRKVSRVKPKGVSVMSIAAWLPGAPRRVAQARIAFGAMGSTPLRAKGVEQALEGQSLDAAGIERALAVVCDGLDPQDDALASAWYRREVAPVHLRRLLLDREVSS